MVVALFAINYGSVLRAFAFYKRGLPMLQIWPIDYRKRLDIDDLPLWLKYFTRPLGQWCGTVGRTVASVTRKTRFEYDPIDLLSAIST